MLTKATPGHGPNAPNEFYGYTLISLQHLNTLTPKGLREPKRPFLILGRLPYVPKVVGVFETS
jgi:hypothetical protein